MRLFLLISTIGLLSIFAPLHASAQSSTNVIQYHFNPKMQPQGALDVISDCAKSDECVAALSAAAAAFGIDPTAILKAAAVIRIVGPKVQGGETRVWLYPRDGWAFCRANAYYHSASPGSGGKMPKTSVGLFSKEVGIYAFTPRQSLGGGRTWVDATFYIEEVPASELNTLISRGRCTLPTTKQARKVYKCGGKGCRQQDF